MASDLVMVSNGVAVSRYGRLLFITRNEQQARRLAPQVDPGDDRYDPQWWRTERVTHRYRVPVVVTWR